MYNNKNTPMSKILDYISNIYWPDMVGPTVSVVVISLFLLLLYGLVFTKKVDSYETRVVDIVSAVESESRVNAIPIVGPDGNVSVGVDTDQATVTNTYIVFKAGDHHEKSEITLEESYDMCIGQRIQVDVYVSRGIFPIINKNVVTPLERCN